MRHIYGRKECNLSVVIARCFGDVTDRNVEWQGDICRKRNKKCLSDG